MKKNLKKLNVILFAALLVIGFVFIGCDDILSDADIVSDGNVVRATTISNKDEQGTHDGYNYEIWRDKGNVSMTLQNGGNFDCQWSNIGNALFRKGKKWNASQTYSQIGNISIDYSASFTPGGNSYLCVYGWSKDPLVEFYIIESYGTYKPTGTAKGSLSVDGGTYELYETTRTNQPSIIGNATFKQFWSVRTSKRTSGTISVSEHFKAWANKGMTLGKMYEVALTVEGYQSSGNASITKHYLNIGGSSSGTTTSTPAASTPAASTPAATTTSSGATRVEAENMTKGGKYTGNVSSPFNGVKLYANDDKVSFSQNFANNSHTFKLRGASNNNNKAQVQLKIAGTAYGIFNFTGTSATEQSITATHNQGGKTVTVELVCVNDNDTWDVLIDWIEISASGSTGSTGTTTTTTTPAATTPAATTPAVSSGTKYTFSQLKFSKTVGITTYSVNSSGALSVTYPGQYKEIIYNLPSNISLANFSSIVVNGSSPSGQTAIKFYDTSDKEAFVKYNNKSSTADWTQSLGSTEKGKTIKAIGIMSQDTATYSATINSITFK